ncbi:hypothetical protein [Phenylobacterium sp.]|uniref:hypothetical protein n=1 Tax=Phenylobacterium sp. TaxID=1871053 RepID=UPI0035B4318B
MATRNLEQQQSALDARTRPATAAQHGRRCDDKNPSLKAKLQEKRSFEPRQAH